MRKERSWRQLHLLSRDGTTQDVGTKIHKVANVSYISLSATFFVPRKRHISNFL